MCGCKFGAGLAERQSHLAQVADHQVQRPLQVTDDAPHVFHVHSYGWSQG